jgi:hypothetical protein
MLTSRGDERSKERQPGGTAIMHKGYLSRGHVASIIVFVALLVMGCEKKTDPVVGPDTPAPSGGTISDETRLKALDTISAVIHRLPRVDPAGDRQTVLNFLKSRPEFAAAGLSPDGGNVWGRFLDGRLFLFLNNRKPGSVLASPRIIGSQIQQKVNRLGKSLDVLPSSSTATIMNSLGTLFPGAQRSVDSIRTWCKKVGYTLTTNDPTIDKLAHISGDGILYWAAHGGTGLDGNLIPNPTFAMWTSDPVSVDNEKKYKAYMDSMEVVYAELDNDLVAGQVVQASHYMVTMKFIGKYMSFAPNSLVYFDACGSGGIDKKYQPMLKTAGFYLGWSLDVADDDAEKTARSFFDRTLGVNMNTPKLTPPQRPFFTGDVLSDMSKNGMDVSGSSRLVHPFEPVLTTLRLLAPSISLTSGKGDVSSTTYNIDGDFGDNPGSAGVVLLNEKPLTFTKWTSSEITVQKPGGGGTLVVAVRNVRSNPVNLTEWHGTIDYTFTGRGSLKQHVVVNLAFWGDVHSFRPNILTNSMYMPFAALMRPVEWMKTSSFTYECSGEYRDINDVVLETWQGGASIPISDLGSPGSGFSASALIDSAGTSSGLFVFVNGTYTRWTKDNGESQQPLNLSTFNIDLKHSMPGFVMKAGSSSQGGGTLTWTDMPAAFPPDPKAAQ